MATLGGEQYSRRQGEQLWRKRRPCGVSSITVVSYGKTTTPRGDQLWGKHRPCGVSSITDVSYGKMTTLQGEQLWGKQRPCRVSSYGESNDPAG